jgi:hypothetical protein
VARWAGLMAGFGPTRTRPGPDSQAARPRPGRDSQAARPRRFEPLVDPVAITEHCVIGDQIRLPAAWCDMAGCAAAFADPAALGETDNRVRAARAGWARDWLGRQICPACQRRDHQAPGGTRPGRMSPYVPETLPAVTRLPAPGDGFRRGTGADGRARPADRPAEAIPAALHRS